MNSNELYKYQTTYFKILENLFNRVVGKDASLFYSFDDVLEVSRKNVESLSGSANPYIKFVDGLTSLYSESGTEVYKFAQELNACKLVLGGSSRFYGSHLNATRSSLLFTDTVLIPDPILPYLEKERSEEKYQHIPILKAAFFILQLKILHSSNFDMLPFIVFPSWEKSLESKDDYTKTMTRQLISDVFTHYVDSGIKSLEDIYEFSQSHQNDFFRKIEQSKLLVAPGRKPGDSIQTSIKHCKEEMQIWRSEEWCKEKLNVPENIFVINAIFERIVPQYHLLENAAELKSNPLLCIDSQAHYYQLVASMKNSFVTELNNDDKQTSAITKALTNPRMDFLANISYDQMIAIRHSKENILFRKELRGLVNSLPSAKLEDLDLIAGEVCAYIEALTSKHSKEVEAIRNRYQASHKYTALLGSTSFVVSMVPILGPFAGLGLVPTLGKYIVDKLHERNELDKAASSLMGVISLAKSN